MARSFPSLLLSSFLPSLRLDSFENEEGFFQDHEEGGGEAYFAKFRTVKNTSREGREGRGCESRCENVEHGNLNYFDKTMASGQ